VTSAGPAVRPMGAGEVGAVADLHRRAFPSYASTKLGAGYCRRMLRAYADRPGAWIDVAVGADGRIIGYLVAAPPATQRAVDRALLPWAALNAFRRPGDLVGNVRRFGGRISRRRRAADAGPAAPGAVAGPPVGARQPPGAATVRVVLVAVDAAARGQGGADALLDAFARTARGRGHLGADLSVAPGNGAAHGAYARNGWRPDGTGTRFTLDLSGPAAP